MVVLFVSTLPLVFGATLAQETQFNNITIFIRFNDETTYEAPFNYDHYDDMLNGVDTVSLRDYYLEASYGSLTIDSYIPNDNGTILFYTDIYDRDYFEPYSSSNPSGVKEYEQALREHELIQRALEYVDAENLIPDDMDLDVNEDGMIDSLTFMISGEDTGWNTLLWPHKWELYSYYSSAYGFDDDAPSINGVNGYYYTWELLGNDTSYSYQVNAGVLAHETFHLLGAPDLYHYYDYLNIEPVGSWGLMEYNGDIPSHMLGYMKEEYGGWIDETIELTSSGTYSLDPLQDGENLYKIYTGFENEWIYLEYRDNDGLYESNLPGSGLLVYRVNQNVDGNESGSYDNGVPSDEVFIFRPGITDTVEPIVLINGDSSDDGIIDDAILSQNNAYDSAGGDSDILLFSSDGTILDIEISNVYESDGSISFDLLLAPTISLVSNDYDLKGKSVILYDHDAMDYQVQVDNLEEGLSAYYTLDGSVPDQSDTLVDGLISIDGDHSLVKVSIYNGNDLIGSVEKQFTFSDTLESSHYPYGDMVEDYYYLSFSSQTPFSLLFNGDTELEEDYDYLSIYSDTTSMSYTGTELANQELEFNDDDVLLVLETDTYLSDYYGFSIDLLVSDLVTLSVNGLTQETIEVYDEYETPAYSIVGNDISGYYVLVSGQVNADVVGEYSLTYSLYNSNDELVTEVVKEVYVVDTTAPIVTLIGDQELYVEANSEFVDPYITFEDNYDTDLQVTVSGQDVDTSVLSDSFITYTVTDDYGNETVIKRIVHIIDSTAPELSLDTSIDTIFRGQEWIDGGVIATDNLSVSFEIVVEEEIDINTLGTYEVIYYVSDQSGNQATISRYVTVIEEVEEIEVQCNSMVTTLLETDQLVIQACFLNGEMMQVDKSDVSMTPGLHVIRYYLELDGVEVSHDVYYMVVTSYDLNQDVMYMERRKEL